MRTGPKIIVRYQRVLVTCFSILTLTVAGSGSASTARPATSTSVADGQRDFDWELGVWRTKVRVLAEPLSDSADQWLHFAGTSVVRPLSNRRANVVELDVSGPNGRIEGLNLRLYEPQTQRWSLTFVNIGDGLLTPSVFGGFRHGVGEFYGDDHLDGRPIKVRFRILRQGPNRVRFEQAFSDDAGVSWETNWVAVDRRVRR